MKISEREAITGRGLDEVRRRIEAAVKVIHLGQPAPVKVEKQPQVYSETHKERFHQRAKKLSLAAIKMSHISTRRHGAWEVVAPVEDAETLIAQALERRGE